MALVLWFICDAMFMKGWLYLRLVIQKGVIKGSGFPCFSVTSCYSRGNKQVCSGWVVRLHKGGNFDENNYFGNVAGENQ